MVQFFRQNFKQWRFTEVTKHKIMTALADLRGPLDSIPDCASVCYKAFKHWCRTLVSQAATGITNKFPKNTQKLTPYPEYFQFRRLIPKVLSNFNRFYFIIIISHLHREGPAVHTATLDIVTLVDGAIFNQLVKVLCLFSLLKDTVV